MRRSPNIRSLPMEEIDVPIPATDEAAAPEPASPTVKRPIDLGPLAAEVIEVFERAGRLTRAEQHRLGEIASFRWWPLTVPVGGSSAGARATAVLRARGAGRSEAIPWLEAHAETALAGPPDSSRRLVVRAVANAALALLARDVVDEDVFDALYGPWREVTHR